MKREINVKTASYIYLKERRINRRTGKILKLDEIRNIRNKTLCRKTRERKEREKTYLSFK